MEPVQLGSLRLQPFGLIFIALLIPFFVLCAIFLVNPVSTGSIFSQSGFLSYAP